MFFDDRKSSLGRIKNMVQRIIFGESGEEDKILDRTLRPKSFADFIGQTKIKENLHILIEAAKARKEAVEHILLYGNPGLGKTTLAHIIAAEIGANICVTSGPALEKTGDLAAILTNLSQHHILFIDEIHRLNKNIEEILYPAMEDFALDLVIGKGPSAKTLRIDLPKFTLIGATTRLSLLSAPLRDRFGAIFHLNFYEPHEIEEIIRRNAKILNVGIEEEAVSTIAACARRTPRVANRLLRRIRDFAQVKGEGKITKDLAEEALRHLNIDPLGLDEIDRTILKTIIEKFNGGPVGLNSLAAATAEEPETIEEIYEPYLIQLGFLERTARGRVATRIAYKHLGFKEGQLF